MRNSVSNRARFLRTILPAVAVATALSLSACGGGGSNTGSDVTIRMSSFSLGSSTLTAPAFGVPPANLTARWSASATNVPANAYLIDAYIAPFGTTVASATTLNPFMHRNCSLVAPCADPQVQSCTFGSNRVLACTYGSPVTLNPGTYTIVAQACYFADLAITRKCDTVTSNITVQ